MLIDFTAGYLIEKAIETGATGIMARLSRRRLEHFMDAFLAAMEADDEEGVQTCLDAIDGSDPKSDALFDAFRRVALSSSRVIGPRIIALITAGLISEDRAPSTSDQQLLVVAEQLTDDEFQEAQEWFNANVRTLKRTLNRNYWVDPGYEEDVAGEAFWESYGAWGAKLQSVGIILSFTRLIKHNGPFEHVAGDLEVKLATDMYYSPLYGDLVDLISRATPVTADTPNHRPKPQTDKPPTNANGAP